MMHAPDQHALIVDAREFAASYIRPNAGVWEQQKAMPLEALHRAAAIGLTAIEIPIGLGGRGCSFSVKAQVAGILAEADFGAAMAIINTHNVGAKLASLAAPHALHRHVPDLVSGQRIGCTALTEANAGSDVTAMQTHAKRTGDGWLLNGEKVWITNAAIADTIIVYAQTREVGDASGIGAFLIDARRTGFERGAISDVSSLYSTGSGSFRLSNYHVDEAEVVAAPGQAFKSIMTEINGARIYVAAMCCGMMRSALVFLGDFGNRRESFGSKLADHQGWRWILAEAASELAAVDALVESAARALDAGDDVQLIASQTKIAATRMAERHLPALCHAMGAEGLRHANGLGRHLMGVRFAGLVDGSTEMLLERVARLLRPR